MTQDDAITVEAFYRYGYAGAQMIAIRAPFAMACGAELIGRRIRVQEKTYTVRNFRRQISGPVQKGEPLGVEIDD